MDGCRIDHQNNGGSVFSEQNVKCKNWFKTADL